MCNLLKDFRAMTEKVKSMETRLKETEICLKEAVTKLKDSENQILELQSKGKTKWSEISLIKLLSIFFIVAEYSQLIWLNFNNLQKY